MYPEVLMNKVVLWFFVMSEKNLHFKFLSQNLSLEWDGKARYEFLFSIEEVGKIYVPQNKIVIKYYL